MGQQLLTEVGAFTTLTKDKINENFTELFNSGGGGPPGGDPGSVQFNDAGSFNGFGSWDGSGLDFGGLAILTSGPSSMLDDSTITINPSGGVQDFGITIASGQKGDGSDQRLTLKTDSGSANIQLDDGGVLALAATHLTINGSEGVTAGPFTSITSITVVNGIITDLQGS